MAPKTHCTIHQSTRSKELEELLHNAGHSISYKDVLRIDTTFAEHTLSTMNEVNGAVVPRNFVTDRFMHFTADNIVINEDTLKILSMQIKWLAGNEVLLLIFSLVYRYHKIPHFDYLMPWLTLKSFMSLKERLNQSLLLMLTESASIRKIMMLL